LLAIQILIMLGLTFGTAILFGAASEKWAGETVSAWLSLAGLMLGIYLLPTVLEFLKAL